MMKKKFALAVSLTFLFLTAGHFASATDGYFSNGQGTKNKGFAGAGIAFLHSPFSAAINPAGLGFLNKKMSFEVELASTETASS